MNIIIVYTHIIYVVSKFWHNDRNICMFAIRELHRKFIHFEFTITSSSQILFCQQIFLFFAKFSLLITNACANHMLCWKFMCLSNFNQINNHQFFSFIDLMRFRICMWSKRLLYRKFIHCIFSNKSSSFTLFCQQNSFFFSKFRV